MMPIGALWTACRDPEPGAPPRATSDTGPAGRAPGELPPHPLALPFHLDRADEAPPITAAERDRATDALLEALAATRWFETVSTHAHGGTADGAPFATWWSGVRAARAGGTVTFTHGSDGADNNGLRTAPLLEAACWARVLSGDAAYDGLGARLLGGFASWSWGMERGPDDERGLLARVVYPPPFDVSVGAVTLRVDTSPARPGEDVAPAQFVHLPDNPRGDVWVRNTRSKDDLGHHLRALGATDACDGPWSAPLVEARRRSEQFAGRIVADDFHIATLDPSLRETVPDGDLAWILPGLECSSRLALSLVATGGPVPDEDCGEGLQIPEGGIVNSSAMQILRHFHLGAVEQALVWDHADLAEPLARGLAARADAALDAIEAGAPLPNFGSEDLVAFLLHASAAGVPLTAREVRWLHGQLELTRASATDPARARDVAVFDPGAPDGEYPFEPGLAGTHFVELGLWLAPCAARYRDPEGTAPIDCARLADAL